MSSLPACTVCDARLDPWGQETRCDRCSNPCGECGGDVSLCSHKLTDAVERELRATMLMQERKAA